MILIDKQSYCELPRAERVVEFDDDDYRENPKVTSCSPSLITPEDWEDFDENSLILDSDGEVLQIAEEFPIVIYQCENSDVILPAPKLNNFIESITVSVCNLGMKYWFEKGKIETCAFGDEVIAYYTDTFGRYIIIDQYDIHRFLLKKPKMTISKDGLLIFYTQREVLVTLDCDHYAWVGIDTETKPIDSIEVIDGKNIVRLKPSYKPGKKKGTMRALTKQYKLEFKVSFYKHGMIETKVSQLKDFAETIEI